MVGDEAAAATSAEVAVLSTLRLRPANPSPEPSSEHARLHLAQAAAFNWLSHLRLGAGAPSSGCLRPRRRHPVLELAA
jgi:hypothetical protein